MKDNNFYTIHEWMITKLNLSGNELICFAVIYHFTMSEKGKFNGTLKELSSWIGCTFVTTISVLKKLFNKGLIAKEISLINGTKFCYYSTIKKGDKQ